MTSITRKQEIINTAALLFKEKGFNAVSMRDLAQEMGIKAASIYNHLPSKQSILGAIIFEVSVEFTNHINSVFDESRPILQKLEAIITMHIDLTLEKSEFLACMNNDWVHLNDADKKQYIKMRNAYEEKFRTLLRQGIREKALKPIDQEIMLFSILSTLRTFYLWYAKHKMLDFEKVKRDLCTTLLTGVRS